MEDIFSGIKKFFCGTKPLTKIEETKVSVEYVKFILSEFQNEIKLFIPHQNKIDVDDTQEFCRFLTNIANSTIPLTMRPLESKYVAAAIPICCCILAKRDHTIANGIFSNYLNLVDAESIVVKAADSVEFISDLKICHLANNKYKICVVWDLSKENKLDNFYTMDNDEFKDTIFLFQRGPDRFKDVISWWEPTAQKGTFRRVAPYVDQMQNDIHIHLKNRWPIIEEGVCFSYNDYLANRKYKTIIT